MRLSTIQILITIFLASVLLTSQADSNKPAETPKTPESTGGSTEKSSPFAKLREAKKSALERLKEKTSKGSNASGNGPPPVISGADGDTKNKGGASNGGIAGPKKEGITRRRRDLIARQQQKTAGDSTKSPKNPAIKPPSNGRTRRSEPGPEQLNPEPQDSKKKKGEDGLRRPGKWAKLEEKKAGRKAADTPVKKICDPAEEEC